MKDNVSGCFFLNTVYVDTKIRIKQKHDKNINNKTVALNKTRTSTAACVSKQILTFELDTTVL